MTNTAKATKPIDKETETVATRVQSVRSAATGIGSAVMAGGRAYITGVGEIGRTIFGFGKELLDDTVQHGKTSLQAKSVRDMAEMQVSYIQHRIETGAAHAQEIVELARAKSENVIEPMVALINTKKAA